MVNIIVDIFLNMKGEYDVKMMGERVHKYDKKRGRLLNLDY